MGIPRPFVNVREIEAALLLCLWLITGGAAKGAPACSPHSNSPYFKYYVELERMSIPLAWMERLPNANYPLNFPNPFEFDPLPPTGRSFSLPPMETPPTHSLQSQSPP
nr:hypothetical protein Iba_chr11cCG9640 [Ipomoea batatas]